MRRSKITAWLLIAAGLFLLLNHFDLLMMDRSIIVILASLFLTIVYLNKMISHPQNQGLFGMMFFGLFTLLLLGMKLNFIPIEDRLGAGLVLISISLANFSAFLFLKHQVSNLIWAIILLLFGLPFIVGYFDMAPPWLLEEFYITYWPIVLIFIGVAVLIDGILRRRKSQPKPKNSFHQ